MHDGSGNTGARAFGLRPGRQARRCDACGAAADRLLANWRLYVSAQRWQGFANPRMDMLIYSMLQRNFSGHPSVILWNTMRRGQAMLHLCWTRRRAQILQTRRLMSGSWKDSTHGLLYSCPPRYDLRSHCWWSVQPSDIAFHRRAGWRYSQDQPQKNHSRHH
jgi:hypothetical protein